MTRDEKTRTLRATIQKLHDDGMSALDMSKALNLGRDVIYYHRKQMGLNQAPQPVNLTSEQRHEIKVLANNRWSYKKIAEKFGIAPYKVKTVVQSSDSIQNRDIGDILADPVNQLLAKKWA